jgi:hypothetical protein
MDGLLGVFNNLDSNSKLLMDKTVNALALTYQNRDATKNSTEATSYRNILADNGELNEDQQVAMKAATSALTAQAFSAGVNQTSINEYATMIANMDKLQEQYEKQEITLEDFTNQYAKLSKQADKFEREVVNKTNLNKMNSSLAATIKKMGELNEKFANTEDESTKMEIAAQMVEQFGITVNESNYEDVANLTKALTMGGEAGYAAFQELMVWAGVEYGLTLDDMSNLTQQSWDSALSGMSTEMQTFVNAMVASGSAMWKELEDGSNKFVMATEDILGGAINTAGTEGEWENPYDELYNLNNQLNSLIRDRERLEKNYDRALESSTKSATDLANITAGELDKLKQEAIIQERIARTAAGNIASKIGENSEFSNYYTYDEKTGTIQVDWEKVDAADWDEATGEKFDSMISYLEEQQDIIDEANDRIGDIEDDTAAIKKRGRDATSEIYNQVKEGLIKERQEQIDHLQSINDSIQEAQDALVDQMQRQIDEARQDRDNAKTEQDISDKETRLAYLMRNSSGSNAMEIAQLQKEIADEKQGYTDTLVDQQLQKLQDANEKAAEQRQRQIDLAQEQLDSYSNGEEIWTEVQRIVDEGFKQVVENNTSFADTEAGKLMASANEFASMNPLEKQDYLEELNALGKEGALFSALIATTDSTLKSMLDGIESLLASIKNPSSENSTAENAAGTETAPTIVVTPTVEVDVNVEIGASESEEGPKLEAKQGPIKPNVFKIEAVSLTEYATGGLADFTGPAWLDGTKSKPEIVLNQTDSENFIALRDILADILNGTTDIGKSNGSAKGGDNYYDIEISVDHLADDYDVEQLADKIRDMIYEDSTYRNVNSISGLR